MTRARRALALVAALLLALALPGDTATAAHRGSTRAATAAGHRHCHARTVRHRRRCVRKTATRTHRRTTRPVAPSHTPVPSPLTALALVPPAPAQAPSAPAGDPPVPPAPNAPTPPPAAPPVPEPTLAPSPPDPGPLRWAPPTLVDPIVVQLGSGYTRTKLLTTRDYVVKLPAGVKIGGTWLIGGHNVVIVGGSIAIATDAASGTAQRTGIYVNDATGTVHVEGVQIDATSGAQVDGIAISAPQATVQLENVRVVGLHGGLGSFHADVVQPWGGVHDLRIDRLTGVSDYQGLTLGQDLGTVGSAELSNVDLTATTPATIDGGGHMLWLTSGSTSCTAFPISFADVYVQPRAGRTMANSVWPQKNTPDACHETGATFGSWPALPFSGGVQAGAPSSGSFVPAGTVGLGYASPGYAAP